LTGFGATPVALMHRGEGPFTTDCVEKLARSAAVGNI